MQKQPTNADIMIIGEAPGANEEKCGKPFVGISGVILTGLLTEIGLKRDNAYITNVCKHRPIGKNGKDRKPTKKEVQTYLPELQKEITTIEPKAILALGVIAAEAVLEQPFSMENDHGEFSYKDDKKIKVIATYHPSALLRNSNLLEAVRSDMQKLRPFIHSNSKEM
ncbi:MAG: uracil-DNA glycosylase [Ignavibacteria bacterium]|jgi:DNA polymerase|nr:uracil-DNA glycosylase [Ignavibacteria bacterium]